MRKRELRIPICFELISLLILLIIIPQRIYANDSDKEFHLENINITINLEKILQNGKKLKLCFPDEPIKLISEIVPVDGKTINELLFENNIRPDYEAYGIVYALNPDIKDLGKITAKEIKLPKIQGGEFLKHLFEYNFKIRLTGDKKLKEKLVEENKNLDLLIEKVSTLEPAKFISSATKTNIFNELKSTSDLLNGINTAISKGIGPPIPTEVLERLSNRIKLLQSDIDSIISIKSKNIGQAELEQVTAVNKDLKIKVGILVETAGARPAQSYPRVKVIIKTLRDGKEISGYRIYYAAVADKEKPELSSQISKVSSPAEQLMEIADWCFWAVEDLTKNRVSEKVCKEVREDEETPIVELILYR